MRKVFRLSLSTSQLLEFVNVYVEKSSRQNEEALADYSFLRLLLGSTGRSVLSIVNKKYFEI